MTTDRRFEAVALEAVLARRNRSDGMRLWLRCTACRYERPHDVGTVYCDLQTAEQRRQGEEPPYSEFVIARRITCPKCGAVDQYELTSDAWLALTAEMIQHIARLERGEPEEANGPLVFVEFTLGDGRYMHPLAAREYYQQQVEAQPGRADLRVRYANVLRFLGYREEAISPRALLERSPNCSKRSPYSVDHVTVWHKRVEAYPLRPEAYNDGSRQCVVREATRL